MITIFYFAGYSVINDYNYVTNNYK